AYGADRLFVDLLRPATRHRVPELRRAFRRALGPRGLKERLVDRLLGGLLGDDALRPLLATLSADEDPLDALALDFYGPFLGAYVGLRGLRVDPWTWPVPTDRLARFLAAWIGPHVDRPVYLLEHGLATRHPRGPDGRPRPDGVTRGALLRDAAAALDDAVSAGLPVAGYFHWSLVDNYEWGSWEPRFGLHGVDHEAPGAPRLATDMAGEDAAAVYRELIRARRPRSA
ncbi:MAG: family 1 glycosylhydrolase, partial [Myxococcales bacterium]|nr:family 1 glycosylhydrolase [Myxococcales bacterium]